MASWSSLVATSSFGAEANAGAAPSSTIIASNRTKTSPLDRGCIQTLLPVKLMTDGIGVVLWRETISDTGSLRVAARDALMAAKRSKRGTGFRDLDTPTAPGRDG